MAVLAPLKLVITNLPKDLNRTFAALDFPFDANRGSHLVTIDDVVYIDKSDFRMTDHEVNINLYID